MEVDGGPAEVAVEALLDPEVLDMSALLQLLADRGIPLPDGVGREEATQLYRAHVLPRPQRQERPRRGRRPTVKRRGSDVDDPAEEDAMMRVGSPMAGSMPTQGAKATRIRTVAAPPPQDAAGALARADARPDKRTFDETETGQHDDVGAMATDPAAADPEDLEHKSKKKRFTAVTWP